MSDYKEAIRAEIARAQAQATAGKMTTAMQSFALARAMTVDLADAAAVAKVVSTDHAGFLREREVFRAMLARENPGPAEPLLIFADSLGLPRPAEKTGPTQGGSATYPWLLAAAQPGRRIDSLCQRYFTTANIVDELAQNPNLGAGSDVVIHVGLNDCSNRMFMEVERLAMGLLPEDIREAIVGFAQKYRRRLITDMPSRHYVTLEQFRSNLDHILKTLQARKARRVVLATIILPPSRFWPGTPGVNANFAAYNLEIMQACQRHGALLLDIDRYVWQDLPSAPLLEDGMHLSPVGHKLFAAKAAELLPRLNK